MWPSDWIRTLFFNSTQSDEQNSKPSPRVRTPELAQSLGSDRIACSVQSVEQNLMINPRIDLSIRAFCMSRNSDWTLDGQLCLFDSIRRTKVRVRVIRPDKNLNPSDSLGWEGYVQFCPNLGLNTRARVQLNPTATLRTLMQRIDRATKNSNRIDEFIWFHSKWCKKKKSIRFNFVAESSQFRIVTNANELKNNFNSKTKMNDEEKRTQVKKRTENRKTANEKQA